MNQPLTAITRPCRTWTPLLGLLALIVTGTGCASDKAVISQANEFHQGLEPAVMNDAQLNGYIQRVGDRIITAAKQLDQQGFGPASHKKEDSKWMFSGMQFHFVNSKTLNAFTTGGNHMYIYTELFEQCRTEDELAAVMSHEFAHVYARHVQKGMNRQMMTMAAAAGAGAVGYAAGGKNNGQTYGGAAAGLAALAGQYFGMSYTRADENQADQLGFQFYSRAGWDPNKFDDFFQTMIDKGYDKTPAMMSDHPTLASRVDATKKRVANLPANARDWRQRPVADDAEFRQLQQRAVAVGKNMPTDQQLAQSQQLLAALPRSCLTPRDQEALPDQRQAQLNIIEALRESRSRTGSGAGTRNGAGNARQSSYRTRAGSRSQYGY
jgi:predicted Zn-dependent protease